MTRPSTDSTHSERRSLTRLVLLLAALAIAGGVFWWRSKRGTEAAAGEPRGRSGDRVISVLTAKVARRDVPIWLEGLGSVAANYTVTVKSQVDGRIDRVFFREGEHVKKGQLLVQIDARPFAIQLESAEAALARDKANLSNARLNLDRYKTLAAQNLIALQQMSDQQASVDQLDAQVRADQAQIDAARLNLDYARVTSPIDGVSGVRLVDPGNLVRASDATGLLVVTQLDPIAVFFTLPEDDLPSVQQAMAQRPLLVEAFSRDGTHSLGEGKLLVIDNEINQATASVRMKALFDNAEHRLWPNQFVKARLKLATRPDALVVPAAVVQHGPKGTFAYVVSPESTALVRSIQVSAIVAETALIDDGLKVGDTVVVSGQAQLRPGARVSAKAESDNAAGEGNAESAGSEPAGRHHGQRSKRGAAPAGSSGAAEPVP